MCVLKIQDTLLFRSSKLPSLHEKDYPLFMRKGKINTLKKSNESNQGEHMRPPPSKFAPTEKSSHGGHRRQTPNLSLMEILLPPSPPKKGIQYNLTCTYILFILAIKINTSINNLLEQYVHNLTSFAYQKALIHTFHTSFLTTK